jgi:hypothetical protein
MAWYIHPSKQLRDDELPPELVVTNRDGSVEQAYTPHRIAKRVRVPYQSHVALGHYECGACGTVVGASDRYCRNCGSELVQ